VCQFANGIKALGFKKGERAIIYMPMSIEAVVAMQACARLGITHSVVFGGFSAKSVQERVVDAGATLIIAADEQMRGGKAIPLKPAIDEAFTLGGCEAVRKVIVYQRTGGKVNWVAERDLWMHEVMAGQPSTCEPSGSTPSIRCSSCTRRVRPASRRACSTPPAATCCGRR
jgi:acetyl-CoA synthetase